MDIRRQHRLIAVVTPPALGERRTFVGGTPPCFKDFAGLPCPINAWTVNQHAPISGSRLNRLPAVRVGPRGRPPRASHESDAQVVADKTADRAALSPHERTSRVK